MPGRPSTSTSSPLPALPRLRGHLRQELHRHRRQDHHKANKEGVGFREISERYIAEHNDDMDRLWHRAAHRHAPGDGAHRGDDRADRQAHRERPRLRRRRGRLLRREEVQGLREALGPDIEEMMAGARVDVGEKKQIPWISPSGRRARRASRGGRAPGARAGRAGTSSAPP